MHLQNVNQRIKKNIGEVLRKHSKILNMYINVVDHVLRNVKLLFGFFLIKYLKSYVKCV